MSLNLLLVRYLRPEVKLMYLLHAHTQTLMSILGIFRGYSLPKSLIFPQVSKLCKTISLRLLVTGLLVQLILSLLSANACSVQEPAMTPVTDIILSCNGCLRPKQSTEP